MMNDELKWGVRGGRGGARWAAGLLVAAAAMACARADGGEERVAALRDLPADSARVAAAPTNRVTAPRAPSGVVPWLPEETPVPASQRWTAGVVERRRGAGLVTLSAVRAARNVGFDRVVFEFAGGPLPGYHVEYIDRPVRQCGSGEVVPLAGQGWLQVRFEGALAHTETGQPTIAERARKPALSMLREMAMTCDFEGQVAWVLGVARPNRFRVLQLSSPARVVVDVLQ